MSWSFQALGCAHFPVFAWKIQLAADFSMRTLQRMKMFCIKTDSVLSPWKTISSIKLMFIQTLIPKLDP